MKYVVWLLRAFLFLILLGFAVKNDEPVVLRYFFGFEWHSSLIVVLLLFFALGVAIGMLAILGTLLRQRRELAALRNDMQLKNKLAGMADTSK